MPDIRIDLSEIPLDGTTLVRAFEDGELVLEDSCDCETLAEVLAWVALKIQK